MKTKQITMVAMMVAIIAIMAQISIPIPISPVPLTLQTAAIILTGIILGANKGALASIIYILIGAIGVPVYASGTAGMGIILGPTGGFLLGFIPMAYLTGFICEHSQSFTPLKSIVFALPGLVLLYAVGAIWFHFQSGLSWTATFAGAVLPFLPLEAVKLVLFAPLATAVKNGLEKIQ